MGAAEKFFHVFGVAAEGFGLLGAGVELDGADWAEALFITKDEIDSFLVDEAISGGAILAADFVAEEGGEFHVGDDIKFLSKNVV